jgi:hypothetical protein
MEHEHESGAGASENRRPNISFGARDLGSTSTAASCPWLWAPWLVVAPLLVASVVSMNTTPATLGAVAIVPFALFGLASRTLPLRAAATHWLAPLVLSILGAVDPKLMVVWGVFGTALAVLLALWCQQSAPKWAPPLFGNAAFAFALCLVAGFSASDGGSGTPQERAAQRRAMARYRADLERGPNRSQRDEGRILYEKVMAVSNDDPHEAAEVLDALRIMHAND